MVLVKTVGVEDFYRVYLRLINGTLYLSDREIDVLAELMDSRNLDELTKKYLSPADLNEVLFGPTNRKLIQKKLGISQHNLNNYIKTLKDKRMLLENDEYGLHINPRLMISKQSITSIEFKLLIDEQLR